MITEQHLHLFYYILDIICNTDQLHVPLDTDRN